MTGAADLTRWNRAGLERFRYVDANAVTLLEDVRRALAEAFPDWEGVNPDIPEPESDGEKLERILAAYAGPRQDWAYEIARSFVRATHILTEHIDAFANEGFLGTATQWEYLRRLTAMLDYRPAPPASAATPVGLIAKDDAVQGTVKSGLAMKFSPPAGGPPVIFETLADLTVDPALNGLRLVGWDQNPDSFLPSDTPSKPGWILPAKHDISAGQPVLVYQGAAIEVMRVTNLTETALDLGPPPSEPLSGASYILGKTTLLADPDRVIAPRLNGLDVVTLARTDGLAAGQVIGWTIGAVKGFARIAAVDKGAVRIADIRPASTTALPTGTVLFTTRQVGNAAFAAAGSKWRFPRDTANSIMLVPAGSDGSLGLSVNTPSLEGPGSITTEAGSFRTLLSPPSAHDLYWFDPSNDAAMATAMAAPAGATLGFDGGPGALASGDLLVAEGHSGKWAAVKVASIAEREDSFDLTLTAALPAALRGVARLHGPFKQALRPIGYDDNDTPVGSTTLTLSAKPEQIPDLLSAGRVVLVETDPPGLAATPFTARIAKVIGGARRRTAGSDISIVLDAPIATLAGFTHGNLVIRGNTVTAGHGESKPRLILGNGDAARTGQEFTLERTNVAFVADALLAAGVRAALAVTVDGLKFSEASTLADSEADDPHFTVQITEDGELTLRFGDGSHGRRLPTGRNNVSVTYRQGTGRAGNGVVAESFEKPSVPHPLIRAIRQPLAATGGQDVEDIAGIRTNAPAHLRTLDRAVSLADIEYLAVSQPGVWHAKAFRNPVNANRRERIELAVVPVDGGALGTLKTTIRDRLTGLSPPGIDFVIDRFDPVELPLRVQISVERTTHDPEIVEPAVRNALFAALSLERRKPGEPIYLSQIYQVVEGVPGVVHSTAHIFDDLTDPLTGASGVPLKRVARGSDGVVWAAWPTGRQVIYLTAIEIELGEVVL